MSKVGFFTDGDWVANDRTGKAVWLTQGFNQYLTPAIPSGENKGTILFTGGGRDYGREAFVNEMSHTYGERFVHISRGMYKQALAQLIADASIIVAPPSPVTDRYWSNRVYLTLGLGGLLLHPLTDGLQQDFDDCEGDITFYVDMKDLHEWIKYYLNEGAYEREEIAKRGQYLIMQDHTYKHRIAQLIKEVEARL